MLDIGDPALVEVTAELVAAHAAHNAVSTVDLPGLLATVYRTLTDLRWPASQIEVAEKPVPPVSVRKSIADDFTVSMEDSRRYDGRRY